MLTLHSRSTIPIRLASTLFTNPIEAGHNGRASSVVPSQWAGPGTTPPQISQKGAEKPEKSLVFYVRAR